jgi:hypothetical protein
MNPMSTYLKICYDLTLFENPKKSKNRLPLLRSPSQSQFSRVWTEVLVILLHL